MVGDECSVYQNLSWHKQRLEMGLERVSILFPYASLNIPPNCSIREKVSWDFFTLHFSNMKEISFIQSCSENKQVPYPYRPPDRFTRSFARIKKSIQPSSHRRSWSSIIYRNLRFFFLPHVTLRSYDSRRSVERCGWWCGGTVFDELWCLLVPCACHGCWDFAPGSKPGAFFWNERMWFH